MVKSPLRIVWIAAALAAGLLVAPIFERTVAAGAPLQRIVSMHDACDAESFNAAVGPGTCLRNGGVQFDDFIGQILRFQSVGGWHFGPPQTDAKLGDTFVAVNKGGEVHTFTEVDDFGGSIIPPLNALLGNPDVPAACQALEDDDFVAPGGTYTETLDEKGVKKFQCCIHPWMHLVATVK
jgi:plastocyanin